MKKKLWGIVVFMIVISTNISAQSNKNPLDDKLVIVLHVQDHYTKYDFPEDSTTHFIENINKIVHSAKAENVIYVKMVHRAINLSLTGISIDTIPFPGGSALDNRLNVVNGNIIDYIKFNIFKSSDINEEINNKGINKIVVVGLMAEECVKKTVLEGVKLGYEMYFVPVATLGYTKKGKLKTFKKMMKKGAKELTVI